MNRMKVKCIGRMKEGYDFKMDGVFDGVDLIEKEF